MHPGYNNDLLFNHYHGYCSVLHKVEKEEMIEIELTAWAPDRTPSENTAHVVLDYKGQKGLLCNIP